MLHSLVVEGGAFRGGATYASCDCATLILVSRSDLYIWLSVDTSSNGKYVTSLVWGNPHI